MIRTFTFLLALAWAGSGSAQTSMSLEQAMEHARTHNAQNKVRSLEQRAAE